MKFFDLVLILLLIWFGMRMFQQSSANRRLRAQRDELRRAADASGRRGASHAAAAETQRCGVCGSYVPVGQAAACGRADCPFPRG